MSIGVRAEARTHPTAIFSQPILARVPSSKQQGYWMWMSPEPVWALMVGPPPFTVPLT